MSGLRDAIERAGRSWFHAAHGLHDDAHHQAHRPLDVCVPLIMVTNEVHDALSSDPEVVGLDVERLAEAMYAAMNNRRRWIDEAVETQAEDIAAEYARLTEAKPETPA